MKTTLWNITLVMGVLCFVGGAALIFANLGTPQVHSLPALGLILVGAGAAGKRKNR